MANSTPCVRGCGTRVAGGLYLENGLSEDGSPVEEFLLCPPQILDLNRLGVTSVGTKLIEKKGVWHVLDVVGSMHYPNVCDFIEEVRRFGLSRRISRSTDLSKLTSASRLILLHSRAHIENFADYAAAWVNTEDPEPGHPVPRCPKEIEEHDQVEAPAMCIGAYWQDIAGGEKIADSSDPRTVERTMPSFSYIGFSQPEGVEPKYITAAFASFPIARVVAINASKEEDEANAKLLGKTSLPTAFEAE